MLDDVNILLVGISHTDLTLVKDVNHTQNILHRAEPTTTSSKIAQTLVQPTTYMNLPRKVLQNCKGEINAGRHLYRLSTESVDNQDILFCVKLARPIWW